jgi:hypothetical protein
MARIEIHFNAKIRKVKTQRTAKKTRRKNFVPFVMAFVLIVVKWFLMFSGLMKKEQFVKKLGKESVIQIIF